MLEFLKLRAVVFTDELSSGRGPKSVVDEHIALTVILHPVEETARCLSAMDILE